jgi:hypothetical protein
MASLNINIPHQLPKTEALERVKKLLGKLKNDHGDQISKVKEQWEGDKANFSFNVKGFDLSGIIKVEENDIKINGNLPFALSFFKGKITNIITQKASEVLA